MKSLPRYVSFILGALLCMICKNGTAYAAAATFVINMQTGTDQIYFSTTKSGSAPTEYLYKKAADNFFKLSSGGAPGGSDAGVLLYKKN